MARVEGSRPKDTLQFIFEQEKEEFVYLKYHPLVPRFISDTITPVIQRAQLVSDAAFREAGIKDDSYFGLSYDETHLDEGSAICMHDATAPNNRAIALKRSTFTFPNDEYNRFWIRHVLTHEAGHALSQQRVSPLIEIPDSAILLYPFNTRIALLEAVNKAREEQHGMPGNLSLRDIRVHQTGFDRQFQSTDGKGYRVLHNTFEDTRATLIGYVFESILYGQRIPSAKTPEEEFTKGTAVFDSLIQPPIKELIAQYIAQYGNVTLGIKRLFYDLFFKDIDTFFSQLPESIGETFIRIQSEDSLDHPMANERP